MISTTGSIRLVAAIDICAGAGGLSLGLADAGFSVLGVELDADAVTTHRENVGPCDHADVTTWSPSRCADLVAGGVPCQPFSVAGDRLGTADPRGVLYRHLIRIAVEARARAILLENVEGMLSSRDYDGTPVVHRIEAEMRAAGYEPRHRVLCAADYGVPQARYRLFVVAFRDRVAFDAFRWPAPTHGEPGLLTWCGLLKPYETVRQALGLGGGRYEVKGGSKEIGWQGMRSIDVDALAPTVNGRNNAEKLSPLDAPSPTVTAGGTESGGAEPFGYAPTRERLLSAVAEAGHQNGAVRLTVEQLATLQDFPRGFVFAGNKGSQHKQVGNAVPRRLGAAVGRALAAALAAVARGAIEV